jgi:hypothetical protein
MTDQQHPITPPPELVQQWYNECPEANEASLPYVATQAARWGADQELLACGKYLEKCAAWEEEDVTEMYNYLRPKPPSLKEQALSDFDGLMSELDGAGNYSNCAERIRRALEQLDD